MKKYLNINTDDVATMYQLSGMTLKEIGEHYGCSPENIQYILNKKCCIWTEGQKKKIWYCKQPNKSLKKNLNLKKDILENMYYKLDMSLEDIGNYYNCSRVNIMYMFEKFQIPLRSKSESRELTYTKGKINVNRTYNREFFKTWSPQMAYALGLLYTDGNIMCHKGKNKTYKRFSFSQTDNQLFNTFCNILSFSGKTYINKKNNCNTIMISNIDMVNDLERLGLHPNKSFTIKFPNIPTEYLPHFIRGIFDGDGCKTKQKVSIISASKEFIDSISQVLFNNDINNYVYSKKYHTVVISKQSEMKKFFDFIYKDKGDIYFEKKYAKFMIVYNKKVRETNNTYDHELFKLWSPKMAYVLGLLYTDGSITYTQGKNKTYKRFSFSQTDKQLFNTVCELLSFSGKTYVNKKNNCNTIMISNTDMVNDLEILGLYPNKSLTLKFPIVPTEFISHFIRGVFDGDGCKTTQKVNIVSASKDFIFPLSQILLDLGIYNKIYSYKYHELRIARQPEIKKFFKLIYKDKGDVL